ncbi:MAG: DISARM system helicase DrmA [Polyangiaceae bacterium]
MVYALRDDLIGPDADDAKDKVHLTESLSSAPSHWYLTGFLAPTAQKPEDKEDEEGGDDLQSALDDPSDGEADAPIAARRPVFPSSLGVSVLVPKEAKTIAARVTYGTYLPAAPIKDEEGPPSRRTPSSPPPDDEPHVRMTWTRTPHEHKVSIPLDGKERFDVPLDGSEGIVLRVVLRNVPEGERGLVPKGTRYATVFLVNQRTAYEKPEQDRGFIFQVDLSLSFESSFVARPNLRGAQKSDDIDERVGDLQYRDCFEFGVGHGISVQATTEGSGSAVRCCRVSTSWLPTVEVEKVVPSQVEQVELRMPELAALKDGDALRRAVGNLAAAYSAWIGGQRGKLESDLSDARRETADALLNAAKIAKDRIEAGIKVLAEDGRAFEAFCLTNKVMASSQLQRERQKNPEKVKRGAFVPTWYPFQLAFLLMNVPAQVDPRLKERDAVDLIFFPTGGGKTEAYLGLAAFTLLLRRLRRPGLLSAGVTVLMRYTLRLLTLDQYERAAALVCALELERRSQGDRLGTHRFSIGLWVGKAATPNRFGNDKDRDETTALNRVKAFRKDPADNPSPIPLDKCPWCGDAFNQDTFDLDSYKSPTKLLVHCTKPGCEFGAKHGGLPVLAVDDQIYRELPCFLIATVDKFAALPWVGKTGMLLGRDVSHANAAGFYGPGQRPPDAKALPEPLLPPDLIIQDELHLISGPLGTLVGLYETAIDHLTTRMEGTGKTQVRIRPKIVASTATVRRALSQIQALFGRDRVDVFPPPGPDRRDSFFAVTKPPSEVNARQYVGLAAPGRSMKVLLMRSYIAVLASAKKAYEQDPRAADPYMTLVGYFNSLRELGGSQRIVEDEVRARLLRVGLRRRVGETAAYFSERAIDYECVELTSRRDTDEVKEAKARLDGTFFEASKEHAPVDVALASNMISVGVDITRLGLMVICGQPKTTAEYIQSSSRVGRDPGRPGLVITLLNVHKPRDRSHFEHFATYHESFYRGVEATSVTPFAPRAVDRGLAGLVVALARLGDSRLTAPDDAEAITSVRPDLAFVGHVLAARAEAHKKGHNDDEPIDDVKATLKARIDALLDSWVVVAKNDPGKDGLAYQRYADQASKRPLLRMPLDTDLVGCDQHERKFVANRSMRDVEGSTDLYVAKLKDSQLLLERGES